MRLIILLFFIVFPTYVFASNCSWHYHENTEPVFDNKNMFTKTQETQETQELCRSEYAVLYSGVTRTPLYSTEHLTPERIKDSKELIRKDKFKVDTDVAPIHRSILADYNKSGYDRGHVAPSADMSTSESQAESFYLSNIVPQLPEINRGAWSKIESETRYYAYKNNLYVVTIPLFVGNKLSTLKGRVFIPTHMAKAVYDVKKNIGVVYVVTNTEQNGTPTILSLKDFEIIYKITPFPKAKNKTNLLKLRH